MELGGSAAGMVLVHSHNLAGRASEQVRLAEENARKIELCDTKEVSV